MAGDPVSTHAQIRHPDESFVVEVRTKVRHALETGALQPTRTKVHEVVDRGMHFLIHQALEPRKKPPKRRRGDITAPPVDDPFDRHDPDLFVSDVSPTHKLLLNKYPVLDEHLLIVTKRFEPQLAPLTIEDFEAIVWIAERMDSLIFYNGGPVAGASQPHKHIQALGLPLGSLTTPLPMWPGTTPSGEPFVPPAMTLIEVPWWPFQHRAVRLDASPAHLNPRQLHALVMKGFEALDILPRGVDDGLLEPYNLLVARQWLWMVPRLQERVGKISINALGFAGSFYAKNAKRVARLLEHGPVAALETVAGKRG